MLKRIQFFEKFEKKERKNMADSNKSGKKKALVKTSDRPAESKRSNKGSKSTQLTPYILLVAAILLLICNIVNIFNVVNNGGPDDHALGVVGYYLCFVFFGIFGPAAYVIPFVLLNLSIFWKKYAEQGRIATKIILTVFTLIVTSAFLHVIVGDVEEVAFSSLFEMGMEHTSGGIFGGYLAYLLVLALKPFGAGFILIAALIPLVLFLVGTSPQVWMDKLSAWASKKGEEAKANAARKAEDRKFEREQARLAAAKAKQEEKLRRAKEEEKAGKAKASEAKVEEPVAKSVADKDEKKTEKAKNTLDDADDEVLVGLDDINADKDEKSGEERDEYYKSGTIPKESDPEMSDGFREAVAAESEDDDEPLDFTALENSTSERVLSEDDEDTVNFIINNPSDDPTTEYGADENAFGGELDGDGKYVVDEVTGEIIGAHQPKEAPYVFPPTDLMKQGSTTYAVSEEEIAKNTRILRDTLESFRIRTKGDIACSCGPTVTRYEIQPDVGVRVKQIANLGDDIALSLAKSGVRIEAPIPGKAAVGVEVPNDERKTVFLRNIIESPEFQNHKSKTAACLGADISGRPMVFDIEKMPHILIAGTTGSGKSICINSIIMSILYKAKPSEVKLILVDPKKVEFNVYRDIPHLSCKIVSDPKKAAGALNSAVNEMEKRFKLIEQVGVRNITGYNEITKNDPDMPYMPRMVIIIDELADLMMTARDDVETAICRLAQKARAAGIHLILGTQRPSVDVITGLIKANIPSRIAFTVRSQVDSRTVIDISGAEKLLGMGDMLYMPVGAPKPIRVQGSFVSDGEVEKIVEYIKANNDPVVYDAEFERSIDEEAAKCGKPAKAAGDDMPVGDVAGDNEDPKLWEAIELAIDAGKISTSLLQRRLEIGYGRAAKIIDRLEEMGFVSAANGNKPREILVTHSDVAERRMNG